MAIGFSPGAAIGSAQARIERRVSSGHVPVAGEYVVLYSRRAKRNMKVVDIRVDVEAFPGHRLGEP